MKDELVEIIPLALRKAKKRGIREKMIIETLRSPEQVVYGYMGRKVAHRHYLIDHKQYLLRVVYEMHQEKYLVITAYLTSQSKRYWKETKK